jgi:DNA-binding transcriptional ArsR family regulator
MSRLIDAHPLNPTDKAEAHARLRKLLKTTPATILAEELARIIGALLDGDHGHPVHVAVIAAEQRLQATRRSLTDMERRETLQNLYQLSHKVESLLDTTTHALDAADALAVLADMPAEKIASMLRHPAVRAHLTEQP